MMSGGLAFFTGHCPWAVSGRVWQKVRAAVAVWAGYTNGTRQNPNWKNLCEIAKALDIHPFEFLLEAEYISETDINPIIRLKGLDKLNSSELDLVQLYVDFLLEKRNEIMKGTGGNK